MAVIGAMARACAHEMVDVLAAALHDELGVTAVELLLADYQLVTLLPVLDPAGPAAPLTGGPAAGCFTQQEPVADGTDLYVPVSIRGDRHGVLRATLPDAGALARHSATLAEVATVLAHMLPAADRATDRYDRVRRTRRLTLAAEMQWALLPGRSCRTATLDFAGQLEPAYAVRGDGFDWSDDHDRFTVTVTNGMGTGMEAATLTTVAITALRNARRAGLSLVDQASLADQALYSQFRGELHLSTLLLQLDPHTGQVTFIDAGSPVVLLLRAGDLDVVELAPQPPLGAQDGTEYTAQHVWLTPGDRLIVVSDGVTELRGGDGNRYAERALQRALRRTRAMAPLDAVRTVVGDLLTHHGTSPLDDDAVVTCLDWYGPRPPIAPEADVRALS
ncbi:PP2C family protein-serine/threonine phosphatase [Pilimelia terevasa]|nr:PP2C family protein-serine/threonine phosphatase [Pilimelia terevasa]